MVYLATALLGDFPVVLIPKVSAADLPRVLAEHQVTVTGASTAFYQMLLAAPDGRGNFGDDHRKVANKAVAR